MERQAEKDREAKLAQIEGDKEAKLATEIELEKLKYSFERQHYVWMIHYMTLLLEILMGQNFRICPIFQLRQLLGLKLIRKRLLGNLMSLNRSLARIKRHLNRLKKVTPN